MKRIGNLFDKIVSIENLRLADQKASKGKANTYGVRLHNQNKEENLQKLHEALVNGTYKTSEYHIFNIYEPKERVIYQLPYYPDRIVHHAIMNILEPIWVSVFTADTFSCIKNRGIHAAATKVKKALTTDPEGTKYCLYLDIKKFYPSIDHELLKATVRKKLKDKRLLALIDEIIDSAPGVPIGNYLSQYLANLYLAYMCHYLKEKLKVKWLFCYADDIIILSDSKEKLHLYHSEIVKYLASLKLTIKNNWQIFPVDAQGVDFVGYVFFHSHTKMRKGIKQRFARKVARIAKRKKPLTEKEFRKALSPWWGWAKHCNSVHLLTKLSERTTYEIDFRHKTRNAA